MIPLSPLDTMFLDLDTRNTPMHIGSLSFYDQSQAPGGYVRFKEILAWYASRLAGGKCFRRRLVRVPFTLGNPYWIEDPSFDIEFHIRHIALPKPGDWRQLCILVSRLFARPLDLSRPPWEVYVIEGLDQIEGLPTNGFALLHKVHHAAIDGISGAEILTATHTLDPSARAAVPPLDTWVAEPEPGDLSLYWRGLLQHARLPVSYARYVSRYALPWFKAWRWMSGREHSLAAAPLTRFNHNITAHRAFDGVCFELAAIKAIKNAVPGTSVNDVVLAICGGGLRHYLDEKSLNEKSQNNTDVGQRQPHARELPEQSLLAMMPKSIRPGQAQHEEGNQISIMRVAIGSHIEDPLQRLRFVHAASDDAKSLLSILGDEVVGQTLGLIAPLAARLTGSALMMTRVSQSLRLFNTVITNVPGPDFPLYFMGCEMRGFYGLGPPSSGQGLFHVVFSYNGQLSIGISACREMLPDPAVYAAALRRAYEELCVAALATPSPSVATVRTRRASRKIAAANE